MERLAQLKKEVSTELTDHILKFWLEQQDHIYGGFYGLVDYELKVHKEAPKGGVAMARFLWSFSRAYELSKDSCYLEAATSTYHFFRKFLIDAQEAGVYWMVDSQGKIIDDRKHIYTQAFGVYGLSEYYKATQDKEALELAISLYQLIENKGFDQTFHIYKEEFNRFWVESDNEMLSENGIIAQGTTNTHLHLLEAYTNLYKVWKNEGLKSNLQKLVDIFAEKIYKKESHFLKVFYNKHYEELIDIQSYGHDIEASWLIDDALNVLEIKDSKYEAMVLKIAENVLKHGINPDGSVITECENGVFNKDRVWWVQAEAMVGFFNAFERTQEMRYLDQILAIWTYTKGFIIDKRKKGEWYWCVNALGEPIKKPIGEPWKTPYHNGRFCFEIIERINGYDS